MKQNREMFKHENHIKHSIIFGKLGMNNHGPKIFNRTKFQQLSLDDLGSTAIWNNPFHGSHTSSNHDFNCDCNCLETSSERKQNLFVWFDV